MGGRADPSQSPEEAFGRPGVARGNAKKRRAERATNVIENYPIPT